MGFSDLNYHLKIKLMKVLILIILCVLAIAFIVFLIVRNQKDEKTYEKEMDNDYDKPLNEDNDIDMKK